MPFFFFFVGGGGVELCMKHVREASSVSFQEKDITLSGEHVREGLTCVVSVKVPNPEFEGQTKVLPILQLPIENTNVFCSYGCF